MARTVNLALSITGKDTSNVSGNSNITDYIELVLVKNSDLLDSWNIQIPAGQAATSIKSTAASIAGVANVMCVLLFTYNSGESTPKCQVVVDGAATLAGDAWAGIYTSTITLATTSLANTVSVQAFFYEAY